MNSLSDLPGYLFEQLERLDDPDLTGDALSQEISRAKAVALVSEKVIDAANTAVRAMKAKDEAVDAHIKLPRMLSE